MSILVPMTGPDYEAFIAEAIPSYAADKVASGQWTEEQSLESSSKEISELLPLGLQTPDNHLFKVLDDQLKPVGTLWLAAKEQAGKRVAYVYDILIHPEFRRQGHATRTLAAAEVKSRELGLVGIGLHVFGHNPAAIALYEKLGYRTTNINMFKTL